MRQNEQILSNMSHDDGDAGQRGRPGGFGGAEASIDRVFSPTEAGSWWPPWRSSAAEACGVSGCKRWPKPPGVGRAPLPLLPEQGARAGGRGQVRRAALQHRARRHARRRPGIHGAGSPPSWRTPSTSSVPIRAARSSSPSPLVMSYLLDNLPSLPRRAARAPGGHVRRRPAVACGDLGREQLADVIVRLFAASWIIPQTDDDSLVESLNHILQLNGGTLMTDTTDTTDTTPRRATTGWGPVRRDGRRMASTPSRCSRRCATTCR